MLRLLHDYRFLTVELQSPEIMVYQKEENGMKNENRKKIQRRK